MAARRLNEIIDIADAPSLPDSDLIRPLRTGLPLYCPHTRIHPKTKEKLTAWGARFVDVSDSDLAYCWFLERLWGEGNSFLLVEHDMDPTADQLDEVAACPEPVCGFPYEYFPGQVVYHVGCSKVSAEALQVPIEWQWRGSVFQYVPGRPWNNLLNFVFDTLDLHGFKPHFHDSLVKHYGIKNQETGQLLVGW